MRRRLRAQQIWNAFYDEIGALTFFAIKRAGDYLFPLLLFHVELEWLAADRAG
jgi:hypothetical protein